MRLPDDLPPVLRDAVDSARWPSGRLTGDLADRIGKLCNDKAEDPHLLTVSEMASDVWATVVDLDMLDLYGLAFGSEDPEILDPHRSIPIGDLGPDAPIDLDYRFHPEEPRVIYLHSSGSRWVEVAPSASAFLEALGIRQS